MSEYPEASQIKIEVASDQTLCALLPDRCVTNVQVLRAFPLSDDNEFIILRDGQNNEIGILESLEGLDSSSNELIQSALRKRYFLPKILKIHDIFERFNSADWDVDTDRGRITIQTRAIHESVVELGEGRILLRDNEDNRFEISNLEALDETSRARFAGRV